ncbi:GNAT family N-acetyltransferase [Anaerosporobacter faecicola]|uniref:GNAT family N-acetyltransferase n=1 Tax=Anaerosporobacter faecicola TaxID=2718714 RepID=UPI00143CB67D|nr:GNAT family N-acetyltransferase [Anaerosporobacter faecicola]
MLEGKYLMIGDPLNDVINVRKQVCGFDQQDSMDTEAIHVIVYENHIPVACGRLLIVHETFLLDGIYVIQEKRNEKIGDFVVRLLVEKAYLLNTETVNVICDSTNKGFFSKLGFIEIKSILTDLAYAVQEKEDIPFCMHIAKEKAICMKLDVVSFKTNHKCCK